MSKPCSRCSCKREANDFQEQTLKGTIQFFKLCEICRRQQRLDYHEKKKINMMYHYQC